MPINWYENTNFRIKDGLNWDMRLVEFYILVFVLLAIVGCGKTGEIEEPPPPFSHVGPTISNLVANSTKITRNGGGILDISCKWFSPAPVSTATAYLAFVRSVKDAATEPIGVIASKTNATPSVLEIRGSESDQASAFFVRFKDPIMIPTGIGTSQLSGLWNVALPFTRSDVFDAPLGKQQMLLWMTVNNMKTNSLAFEIEFTDDNPKQ